MDFVRKYGVVEERSLIVSLTVRTDGVLEK